MNLKDKAIELLKEYSNENALKIVASHANDKVDYEREWPDDLFYKGIQFAEKHGTNYNIIKFVNNKLCDSEYRPKLYDLEDTVDYVLTEDNLNKMNELLEREMYA